MRNVIPIGFIKGPREPKRLDSFLLPLVQEIMEMNAEHGNRGALFECADGTSRNIKVHVIWCKGDGPAVQKIGGFVGAKGKRMCRFCEIEGFKCSHCRSYYFPSKMRILETAGTGSSRCRLRRMYSATHLPIRTDASIEAAWRKIDRCTTKTAVSRIITETGLKPRTCLFNLESIFPVGSFPLDVMHLVMNFGSFGASATLEGRRKWHS